MGIETQRRVTKEIIETEIQQAVGIERVSAEELQPRVGSQAEKLKLLSHVLPDSWRQALTESLSSDARIKFTQTITEGDDLAKRSKIEFIKDGPGDSFEVNIYGPLKEQIQEVPKGLQLKADFPDENAVYMGYRKINPQAKEPLMSEGKILQPGDSILVLMKGKKTRWDYRLPKEAFPKGGRVTAVLIPDIEGGVAIKSGEIICYIEPLT